MSHTFKWWTDCSYCCCRNGKYLSTRKISTRWLIGFFYGKYNQPPQFKLQLSEAVLKVPITDLLAKTDSRFIDDVNQALESFNQRHSEAGIFGEQVLEGLYSIKTLREKYYEKYAQRLSDEKKIIN